MSLPSAISTLEEKFSYWENLVVATGDPIPSSERWGDSVAMDATFACACGVGVSLEVPKTCFSMELVGVGVALEKPRT
jgi:hypothetical protein